IASSLRYGSASMITGQGPSLASGKNNVADSEMPSVIWMRTCSRRAMVSAKPSGSDPPSEPHDRAQVQIADATGGQDRPEQPEDGDDRDQVRDDERPVDVRGRDRLLAGVGVDRDGTRIGLPDDDLR